MSSIYTTDEWRYTNQVGSMIDDYLGSEEQRDLYNN